MIPLLYGVVCDYGRNGRALNEVCLETSSKHTVARQILAGEYGTILEVWCLDREESSLTDASEEMAQYVFDCAKETGETIPWEVVGWIEEKLNLIRGVA